MLSDTNFSKFPQKSLHNSLDYIQQVLENSFIDTSFSGSTLISLLLQDNSIISTNVGDSRAILARRNESSWTPIDLSFDHKPDLPLERERIFKLGGIIEPLKDEEGRALGPLRVWHSNGNNGSNCGIARHVQLGIK